jgi:hypothetical protein
MQQQPMQPGSQPQMMSLPPTMQQALYQQQQYYMAPQHVTTEVVDMMTSNEMY